MFRYAGATWTARALSTARGLLRGYAAVTNGAR